MSLLCSGAAAAKANATALLWRLVEENKDTRKEMARACQMDDLIGLLKGGRADARKFALWSLSLSIDASSQNKLLEEEVVEPIVAALSSPEASSRQQAAAAITLLANQNKKAQLEIAKKGGIVPLIRIVRGYPLEHELQQVVATPATTKLTIPAVSTKAVAAPTAAVATPTAAVATPTAAIAAAAPSAAPAAAPAATLPATLAAAAPASDALASLAPAAADAATTAQVSSKGDATTHTPAVTTRSTVALSSAAKKDIDARDSMEARQCAAAALADLANLKKNVSALLRTPAIRSGGSVVPSLSVDGMVAF